MELLNSAGEKTIVEWDRIAKLRLEEQERKIKEEEYVK